MYGLLPIARILRSGNQRMKVGLASVIIIPSDPLAEYVFPIHAISVFARLEVLIPRKVWGSDCFIHGTHKNYIKYKALTTFWSLWASHVCTPVEKKESGSCWEYSILIIMRSKDYDYKVRKGKIWPELGGFHQNISWCFHG